MRATLGSGEIVLTPDRPAEVVVEVTNTSEVIDGLTASVDLGEGLAWVSEPPLLPLFPDGTGTITLHLTASQTFPAGSHESWVEVRSSVRPDEVLSLRLRVEVAPRPAAELAVVPPVRRGRTGAAYDVVCFNTGNTPIELDFAASDPERVVAAEFEPTTLAVAPGSSGTTSLVVRTKRQWFGTEVRRPVSIVATSRADEIEVPAAATFHQQPTVPRGVRTAIVLGLIVALWAVVFLLALDRALAKDALTKQAPASFYWPNGQNASSSALTASTSSTSCTPPNPPPGGVPKTGVAIGVGGTVVGKVTAASTQAGVGRISVEAYQNSPCGMALVSSAATDSTGLYSLVGLLPGQYQLEFVANGYRSVWYPDQLTSAKAQPISVGSATSPATIANATIVGNPGSLTGTVETGQVPPAPVTVQAVAEPGATPVASVQTSAGVYTIPGLPTPGTYDLIFTAPGYGVASDQEELAGGQAGIANTITLTATPGSISGLVTDGHNPLGGVTVTASANGQTFTSGTPTSGTIGVFALDNLPTPATYLLTFAKSGFGTLTLAETLGPGQVLANVPITLLGGAGTVSGVVTDTTGQPLGGATVTVAGAGTPITTQTLTAGQVGSYFISGLATPGNYTLSFSLSGYQSQTVGVRLGSSGSASGVDATLPRFTGSISGTVASSQPGSPKLAGVSVSISDGTAVRTTMTASSPAGGFSITGLPPGAYAVTFSMANYTDVTALVQLAAGGSSTLSIVMPYTGPVG
jgi:hypothetical protein